MTENIWKKRQKAVLDNINEARTIEAVMQFPGISEELDSIERLVKDDTFRVAVVGEFSAGKSTFINSIIGKDILMHNSTQTTATITYIRNVAENDERCGTCEVVFRDKSRKTISNLESLLTYTTVQSENNVVEDIESVTVFIHFIPTDHPVTITDTPGLNGTLAGHTEITVDEIKKAHSCIYLLSKKGVTDSDTKFINMLSSYQRNFIFLQNFMDELKISEGETIENKLADDRKNIDENIVKRNPGFRYNIIAISALKALAAKDLSIKKMYADDFNELTEQDRPRLYAESNLTELENLLRNMMDTGEYMSFIIESAENRLKSLLDGVLERLLDRQIMNNELIENDEATKRIEIAKRKIESMQENAGTRKKRIENFIIGGCDKRLREVKSYINSELESIYNESCEEIDSMLKNHDDYKNFLEKHKVVPAVYYGKYVSDRVNKELLKTLADDIKILIHRMYEEALAKVMTYTNSPFREEKFNIDFSMPIEKFEMDSRDHQTKMSGYKTQVSNLKKELKRLESEISLNESKMTSLKSTKSDLYSKKNSIEKNHKNSLSSLGSRPNVRTWKTYHNEERDKGGFFGSLLNLKETVQVADYHSDDSARRSWEQKRKNIERKYSKDIKDVNDEINDIENQIAECEDIVNDCRADIRKTESKIASLNSTMKNQNELFETAMKIEQGKFVERKKNEFKEEIRIQLLEGTEKKCMAERLIEYCEKIFLQYRDDIIRITIHQYEQTINEQRKNIESLIRNDSSQLEQKYRKDEADIEKVKILCEKFSAQSGVD